MGSLQRLCCEGFVAMASVQWFSLLPTKLPSLFTTSYTGKYQPVFKDFYANETTALAVQTFS